MGLERTMMTLLKRYIEENKQLKEKHKQLCTKKVLCEELINSLKEEDAEDNKLFISILIDTIYEDPVYMDEFYQIFLKPDKKIRLLKFTNKIIAAYNDLKQETEELQSQIERTRSMVSSAKRVIVNLKYRTRISSLKNDIDSVKRIISYYEVSGVISNKEELLLNNELELHNTKIDAKKENSRSSYNREIPTYDIANLLSIGFQEHDVVEISKERKEPLNKLVKEIINTINFVDIDKIIEVIKTYEQYNLGSNEYKYIIVKILDEYLEELITLYELLIDKDIYTNKTERIDVIRSYYRTLSKYLHIKSYYEQITQTIVEVDTEIEEQTESQDEITLIYSHSETNIKKSRFISDLSDIPYEYYQEIYNLIMKFKKRTLSQKKIKAISCENNDGKNDGHIELKDDNIRIILKRVSNNMYNVLGVFIKKSNNAHNIYNRIMNRLTPIIDTKEKLQFELNLAKTQEDILEKIVSEKARKNGR